MCNLADKNCVGYHSEIGLTPLLQSSLFSSWLLYALTIHTMFRVIINDLQTFKNLFQNSKLCIIMKSVEHKQELSRF